MMRYLHLIAIWLALTVLALFSSCKDDEDSISHIGVAFESTSLGIDESSDNVIVTLSFTRATVVESVIEIAIVEDGVSYGTQYTTTPAASEGIISLTVAEGATETSFTVTRMVEAIAPGNSVTFEITGISGEEDATISGNTRVEVSFEAIASAGGFMTANIGGPTEPNLVFVDLSLNRQVAVERTSWDLGFYTGAENRVILNYGTYMAAKAIDKTDLNAVTAEDTVGLASVVAVGAAGSNAYIDDPDGDLNKTAIAEISPTASENKVYIINLGGGPAADTVEVEVNSTAIATTPRGWKKVRFLLSGNDYLVQHADIGATSFTETTVSKDPDLNFTYFSFEEGANIPVEPEKDQWDIVFTPHSNFVNFMGTDYAYGFADFLRINGLNMEASVLNTEEGSTKSYDDFTLEDANRLTFSSAANVFGGSWRTTPSNPVVVHDNYYFVIKDPEGNYYKMQVLKIINDKGVRGHTEFKYERL